METSQANQPASLAVQNENEGSKSVIRTANRTSIVSPAVQGHGNPGTWRAWIQKDIIAFFILGIVIAIPTMIVSTGANAMFPGVTGAFGLALSCIAAFASFLTPLLLHHLSLNLRVIVSFVASVLCFIVCTLGSDKAGPVIGTMLAGFVYAFANNSLLAAAAFFDQKTVLALSTGSGFSVVIGPLLYIGLMKAFDDSWRKTYLVCLPIPFVQPLVWWAFLSKAPLMAAEHSRLATKASQSDHRSTDSSMADDLETAPPVPTTDLEAAPPAPQSFGPARSRLGLFFKVILPVYVVPLLVCTSTAVVGLFGLAPTFESLNTFQRAPGGDLHYELSFLAYGTAQFLFSLASSLWPLPHIWVWAAVQVCLVVVSVAQLFEPFLTYYGVWIVFIFLLGGIVGGSVTNTNHKIAEDFRRKGEPEEVRSFAMSFGGLGNFGGDAIGGGLGIVIQRLALAHLPVRS